MGKGDRTYRGIKVDSGGFHEYMLERVGPRRTDAEGIQMVKKVLGNLDLTGFESPTLDRLKVPAGMPNGPWRAEAPAECCLEDYEGASFPHPACETSEIRTRPLQAPIR